MALASGSRTLPRGREQEEKMRATRALPRSLRRWMEGFDRTGPSKDAVVVGVIARLVIARLRHTSPLPAWRAPLVNGEDGERCFSDFGGGPGALRRVTKRVARDISRAHKCAGVPSRARLVASRAAQNVTRQRTPRWPISKYLWG